MFLAGSILFAFVGLGLVISTLLKLAVFFTVAVVFLGTLFKGKNNNSKRPTAPPRGPNSLNKKLKHNSSAAPSESEINLDDEMSHLNKVSSTSFSPVEEPWNHKWTIKGTTKEYGPYTFNQLHDFFEKGKVKGEHSCFSPTDGNLIKISAIINKKAS